MRVRLKGVNQITKRLADGSERTYHYAWKGGPRLDGKPGTPEFIASFNRAAALKEPSNRKKFSWLIENYLKSPDYSKLSPSTKKTYMVYIKMAEAEFGDMPIAALRDRRVRSDFFEWRDKLADRSLRQADLAWAVVARVVSFNYDRGLAPSNPLERPGRLYKSTRAQVVWSDTDAEAFYSTAPRHLQLALTLALWTGQRQGDLLKLVWADYDGKQLRFHQKKTGARVLVPASAVLRSALAEATIRAHARWGEDISSRTILVNLRDATWSQDGFRASWNTACKVAGIRGKTFHDLRGTAVTRLAIAGCSEAEIASITGHSLPEVSTMLQRHYLKLDQRIAESAISKLEKSTSRVPN